MSYNMKYRGKSRVNGDTKSYRPQIVYTSRHSISTSLNFDVMPPGLCRSYLCDSLQLSYNHLRVAQNCQQFYTEHPLLHIFHVDSLLTRVALEQTGIVVLQKDGRLGFLLPGPRDTQAII